MTSIVSNPLFVALADGNYRLQAGSPALTMGRARYGIGGPDDTIIPADAYITGTEVIGPASGGLPTSPRNLRITTPP